MFDVRRRYGASSLSSWILCDLHRCVLEDLVPFSGQMDKEPTFTMLPLIAEDR